MDVSFQITNDLAELNTLQAHLKDLQSVWLLTPKTVAEINLVLEEIIANIIAHGDCTGPHPITITLTREGQELTMTVADEGPSFDPTICAAPDITLPLKDRKTGGLGLHLVRTFCQGCSYTRKNNTNILILKRLIPKECR